MLGTSRSGQVGMGHSDLLISSSSPHPPYSPLPTPYSPFPTKRLLEKLFQGLVDI
ncbi:hypothetical protein GXM_04268 [Nostoc sphaeroides CCNUC1]|uniref:Uncharacterized protein n=1 Tax=Nostoc sphaeroides CCNUC1 TaxID=2653204 RepID=A0A5P8W229_9NOSO|nr:hypothetical protein GXM_04268 [Nostoc sphaeroides CCNUC1]